MRNIAFKMNMVELRDERRNEFTKDFVTANFEITAFGFKQLEPDDLSPEEKRAAHDFIIAFVQSEECPDKDRFELFCEAQAVLEGKRKIGMLFRPKLAAVFPFKKEVIDQYSKYKKKAAELPIFDNYSHYPSIF